MMARPRPCFCGGDYVRGRCHRDDCPRAKLGNGSWHVALPKLQALFNKGQLTDRYPQLDLFALEDHVHQAGLAHENRKRQRLKLRGPTPTDVIPHEKFPIGIIGKITQMGSGAPGGNPGSSTALPSMRLVRAPRACQSRSDQLQMAT